MSVRGVKSWEVEESTKQSWGTGKRVYAVATISLLRISNTPIKLKVNTVMPIQISDNV